MVHFVPWSLQVQYFSETKERWIDAIVTLQHFSCSSAKSMSIMSRFRQFSFAILDLLAIGDGWFGTRFGWYKIAMQWTSLLQNGFIHAGIMLLTCNDHQWSPGGSAAWKGCWGLGDPSCKLLCFQVGFVASPSFCRPFAILLPSFCPSFCSSFCSSLLRMGLSCTI